MQRRLAAILAADLVGYARLVGEDERGTLAALKALRREVVEPRLAARGGRIVKLMGDGLLAEFPSAVEAVHAAVEVQLAIGERAALVPEPRRLALRIGINLGDIVVDGTDILGDGVNVAARLEALAEPGGIALSRAVLDQLRGRLALTFAPQGQHRVKNIAQPVEVWRVVLDQQATALVAAAPAPSGAAFGRRTVVAAVAALLLLISVGAAWWLVRATLNGPNPGLSPDRPSLAVLPFENLSDDRDQDWFADGITEDLITDLAKVSGLTVIARNSAFTYKDRAAKVQDIAGDLGVGYVLEGSLRRAGEQIRVNVQLVDGATGAHLWAERFDEAPGNVFQLQDRVTRRIVDALAVRLTTGDEQRLQVRETESVAAYEAFLRGWEHARRLTPEDLAAARDYFEKAVTIDPRYGRAHAALAYVHLRASQFGWSRALGVGWNGARLKAGKYLESAWSNPTPLAHRVASEIYLQAMRLDDALDQAERARALDPQDPENLLAVARASIFVGRAAEAVDLIESAKRTEVYYPWEYPYLLGLALFGLDRFADAAAQFEASIALSPANELPRAPLAAALAYLGREAEARRAFEEYVTGQSASPRSHAGVTTVEGLRERFPYQRRVDRDRLLAGLSSAAGREILPPNELPPGWGQPFEPE